MADDATPEDAVGPASSETSAAPVPNPYMAPAQQPVYYVQPGYAPAAPGPARGLSIASMVLGIASVTICCWLGPLGLAAVITGHIAQKKQPWARPMWLTGLITGYVAFGVNSLYWLFQVVLTIILLIGSATY
jgi:hypothetical protein